MTPNPSAFNPSSPRGSLLSRLFARYIDVPGAAFDDPFRRLGAQTLRAATILVVVLSPIVAPFLDRKAQLSLIVNCLPFAILYYVAGRGGAALARSGWVVLPTFIISMLAASLAGTGLLSPCVFAFISTVIFTALVYGARVALINALGSLLTLLGLVLFAPFGLGRRAQPIMTLQERAGFAFAAMCTVSLVGVLLFLWERAHRQLLAAAIASARAQQEATTRAAALAELDQLKTRFFNDVSHELRTPLQLSLLSLEAALQVSSLPDAVRAPLQRARVSHQRLRKLVNGLLDFAQLEAGRMSGVLRPVDLSSLTYGLANEFRPAIENAGLTFTVSCSPLARLVKVDPEHWEKIVFNLLSNALKFTLAGEIRLSLRAEGPQAVLRVADTGCGIAAEDVRLLFQRFQRIQSPMARSMEGSGIGLALVTELCQLQGGSVDVESAPGVGTTFIARLPLLAAETVVADQVKGERATRESLFLEEALSWLAAPAAIAEGAAPRLSIAEGAAPRLSIAEGAAPRLSIAEGAAPRLPIAEGAAPRLSIASESTAPAAEAGQPQRPRIVLAEDSTDLRNALAGLLSATYDVVAVGDGQAALEAVKVRLPDLVLSDVMMPVMNGVDLVRALRADLRTELLPVILLSARAGEESVIAGLESGADEYLIKPISQPQLKARIAAALHAARMRKAAINESEMFLHIVAHDLRNPLQIVQVSTELLKDRVLPQELVIVDRLTSAVRSLQRQVKDLVDLARLESGRLTTETLRVELRDLCMSRADLIESTYVHDVNLSLPRQDVFIEGDAQRLAQVIDNLLLNALRVSDRPVTLGLTVTATEADITVGDEGPGLPAELLVILQEGSTEARRRLAKPGFSGSRGGLGLGLLICKELVALHHGRLWVESEPGQGTTFHITLPLRSASEQAA